MQLDPTTAAKTQLKDLLGQVQELQTAQKELESRCASISHRIGEGNELTFGKDEVVASLEFIQVRGARLAATAAHLNELVQNAKNLVSQAEAPPTKKQSPDLILYKRELNALSGQLEQTQRKWSKVESFTEQSLDLCRSEGDYTGLDIVAPEGRDQITRLLANVHSAAEEAIQEVGQAIKEMQSLPGLKKKGGIFKWLWNHTLGAIWNWMTRPGSTPLTVESPDVAKAWRPADPFGKIEEDMDKAMARIKPKLEASEQEIDKPGEEAEEASVQKAIREGRQKEEAVQSPKAHFEPVSTPEVDEELAEIYADLDIEEAPEGETLEEIQYGTLGLEATPEIDEELEAEGEGTTEELMKQSRERQKYERDMDEVRAKLAALEKELATPETPEEVEEPLPSIDLSDEVEEEGISYEELFPEERNEQPPPTDKNSKP